MEFLSKLNPEAMAAWLQVLVILVGVIAALRAKWRDEVRTDKLSRWDFIKQAVPEAHGVVQKIAKMTKTKKDDEFVNVIDKLLAAAGYAPVVHTEKEAVKALGTGYHQDYKLTRDTGVISAELAEPLPLKEVAGKVVEEVSNSVDPCPEPAVS